MDTFQITVLSIASIVLIGILIVVGMLMKKQNKSVPFPPVSTDCPDGWETIGKMCIPNDTNPGVFKGATTENIVANYMNNDNNKISKDFKKYSHSSTVFCKTGALTDASTEVCNKIDDWSRKQECLRCMTVDKTKDGILMTDELWSADGKSARCAKKAWANRFGFTWDGVSNYNSC
jgi:hypothetical protein